MKKKYILLIIGLVISFWLIIGFGLMSFLGQKKEVASVEQFAQVARFQQRLPIDVTHEFADQPEIVSAQIATVAEKDWQVEFYHMKDSSTAATAFNSSKTEFEAEKTSPYKTSSVSLRNFSTFSMTSNAIYYYLARVEHTFLYVKADATYKDDIKAFVDQLGY